MNNLTVTGSILSIFETNNVANILLADRDNPKNVAFKVALWGPEGTAVLEKLDKGDEITVAGMVYSIEHNKYGSYIDVRQCKLITMTKVQRMVISTSDNAVVEDSLPQEGD